MYSMVAKKRLTQKHQSCSLSRSHAKHVKHAWCAGHVVGSRVVTLPPNPRATLHPPLPRVGPGVSGS